MTDFVSISDYDAKRHNAIRWCACTLNFFRGCSPVSEGCKNCYAAGEGVHQNVMRPEDSSYRDLAVLRDGRAVWTGIVRPTGLDTWLKPFRTRDRMLAFANSMSDVFHENLSDEAVLLCLRFLMRAEWHTFQVVTKRHERMADFMRRLVFRDGDLQLLNSPADPSERFMIPNVWFGVTVENQRWAGPRVGALQSVNAVVRFLSIEPLLGPVDLREHLTGVHWVICGGESGKDFRPMEEPWARSIRDQCVVAGIPFFFKQRSGRNPGVLSKELDGLRWEQLPRRELGALPSDMKRRKMIEWGKAQYERVFVPEGAAAA